MNDLDLPAGGRVPWPCSCEVCRGRRKAKPPVVLDEEPALARACAKFIDRRRADRHLLTRVVLSGLSVFVATGALSVWVLGAVLTGPDVVGIVAAPFTVVTVLGLALAAIWLPD